MSATICIFSEDRPLDFDCEIDADSDPVIWIRSRGPEITVSLNLSRADRAKLRAALDRADYLDQEPAIADKGDTK